MTSTTNHSALPEIKPQIQHIIKIPEQIEPMVPDQCYIHNVPLHLRKLNVEAYTPQFISIGPLHSDNSDLKQENHKQRYFHAFRKRLSNQQALALDQYKTFLEENREKMGNCYSKPELYKEENFVDIILLDSVFIMELFLRKSNKSEQKNDYFFTTSWICKITQRDLLLLENQLPFFVLEELRKRVLLGDSVNKENHAGFIGLAFNYFEDYYPHKSKIDQNNLDMVIKNFKSCKHFTDLIRLFYLREKVHAFTLKDECVLKTATNLNEAGVSFEKVHNRTLLKIKFKNVSIFSWFLCLGCLPFSTCFQARLQIPQLKVIQTTECVLRNLIALEQCHYSDCWESSKYEESHIR